MGKEGQHSAEQAFGALDLNGDGYAARGELLNALGQLREPMRGQDARVVFQGVDANEDGVVEFPEFKAAFEYAREHEGDGTEPHKPATRTNPGEENVEVKVAPPQEQNDNPRTRDWDVKRKSYITACEGLFGQCCPFTWTFVPGPVQVL